MAVVFHREDDGPSVQLRGIGSDQFKFIVMSLLREIENNATNDSVSVATLLRKTRILATRLAHKPLRDWVDWELNGYPSTDTLPPYRRVARVAVLGHFSGPFGSGLRNARIPESAVPNEWRDSLFGLILSAGVAEYEALLSEDSVRFPWPTDVVAHFAENFYEDMNAMSIWRVAPRTLFVGLLDAVRNRVLDFVLEIEAENPDAGEGDQDMGALSAERVTQIFNTTIYGNSTAIAVGGGEATTVSITSGPRWETLRSELRGFGVPEDEIEELGRAIEADRQTTPPGQIGERTQNWLGRLSARAAQGAITFTAGASGEVVAGGCPARRGFSAAVPV